MSSEEPKSDSSNHPKRPSLGIIETHRSVTPPYLSPATPTNINYFSFHSASSNNNSHSYNSNVNRSNYRKIPITSISEDPGFKPIKSIRSQSFTDNRSKSIDSHFQFYHSNDSAINLLSKSEGLTPSNSSNSELFASRNSSVTTNNSASTNPSDCNYCKDSKHAHHPDVKESEILGNTSFLNNINYLRDHVEFLTEKAYQSPQQIDSKFNDYLSISPNIIPGYKLLQQLTSSFDQSNVLFHALKNDDYSPSDIPHIKVEAIESNANSKFKLNSENNLGNHQILSANTKVIIRLSSNLLKNISISRFLNEWHILSGLNIPKKHRLWTNTSINNEYIEEKSEAKFDSTRRDIYQPITLPNDIKGILYPIRVLSINITVSESEEVDVGSIYFRKPDANGILVDNIIQEHKDQIEHEILSQNQHSSTPRIQSPTTKYYSQKRLALIYPDNDYRTLKEYYQNQEPKSFTNRPGIKPLRSSSSLNSVESTPINNNHGVSTASTGLSIQEPDIIVKTPDTIVEIISDMISVLHTLSIVHEFGTVHNGITCSNILKSLNNKSDVKLTGWDFSFSIQPESCAHGYRKTHLSEVSDLLPYIAPESTGEMNKPVDYRADFYSLGIVLYQLILGHLPFRSDNPSKIIRMHLLQKPKAPSILGPGWINDKLSATILKLLEKNPVDRYDDCFSLINDLIDIKISYLGAPQREDMKLIQLNRHKIGVPPFYCGPREVYGRDKIYKEINDNYDLIYDSINFLLITGEEGIGKSQMMNDLIPSVISKCDFYCYWTFNRLDKNISVYAIFLNGIKTIIRQILSSSDDTISNWRELIMSKIPLDLSILFHLIPDLSILLGPKYASIYQHKASEFSMYSQVDEQTVNLELKFRYIIKSLYCLISLHGLTIFLDDVQWCTQGEWVMISEILEFIALNELQHDVSLKLIGTYTTGTVDTSEHIVSREKLLAYLHDSIVNVSEYHLDSIDKSEFTKFVTAGTLVKYTCSDSCGSCKDGEIVLNMANKLYDLTNGSIMHAMYYGIVSALTGSFEFYKKDNKGDSRWMISISDEHISLSSRSNIVQKFLHSVLTLEAQSILKFAAIKATGNAFNLADITIVSSLPLKKVYELLHMCIEARIILPISTYYKVPFHLFDTDYFPFDLNKDEIWTIANRTDYRFLHNSLQSEILNELKVNNELEEYHRLCGLRYYAAAESENNLNIISNLQMAGHLSKSWKVAKEEDSQIYFDALIRAGRLALSTYNLKTSLEFFQVADKFIPESDLSGKLKAAITISQNHYFLKEYNNCLEVIKIAQDKYNFDETNFLLTRVRCLVQSGKSEEGLKAALFGLQKLGIEVDESKSEVMLNEILPKLQLSIPEIRLLKGIESTKNNKIAMIYELISEVVSATQMSGKNHLRNYLISKLYQLMETFGASPYCSLPLLSFANMFAKLGDKSSLLKSIELSSLALYLVDNAESISFSCVQSAYELYVTTLAGFIEPMPKVLKYYDAFIYSALPFSRSNSPSTDVATALSNLFLLYLTGHADETMRAILPSDRADFNPKIIYKKDDIPVSALQVMHGKISLDEFQSRFNFDNKSPDFQFCFYIVKMIYLSVSFRYDEATELTVGILDDIQGQLPNMLMHIQYYMVSTISLIKGNCSNVKKQRHLVDRNMNFFQLWASITPKTFKSKLHILQALIKIRDEPSSKLDILDLFEDAILVAKENSQINDVAWAGSLCAQWLQDIHSTRRIPTFAKLSYEAFKTLDAEHSAEVIEIEFKEYLQEDYNWAGLRESDSISNKMTDMNHETPLSSMLNLFFSLKSDKQGSRKNSVVGTQQDSNERSRSIFMDNNLEKSTVDLNKAVQACLSISESSDDKEIVLNLLERTILFSSSDYGVVVICKNKEPLIQAFGSANNIFIRDNEPLSSRVDICPYSLITHVLNTGKIANKDEDHIFFTNQFGKDDYFKYNKDKSMLCLPLKNQSGVFGALYLENKKSPAIIPFFNAQKRDLLQLLCTQAAVSLGKAKLYAQMEIAKKAAEDATAEKASFLANMSHEIRTPFNSLLSCSIFLLDTELSKTQREYVETIKSSAMVTLNIIDGILAFSKIEHGSFTLEQAPFSLNECIESAILLSGEQAATKDLELAFLNKCQDIKFVNGDVTRVRQIIINLVGNAVKFTTSGYILVECCAKEITENRYEICICVKDTGIGIPDDSKPKIFGAFTQVDGSSSRKFGGSGLGLAISKKLSDIMNGSLTFESNEGVGSTFRFTFTTQIEKFVEPEVYFGKDQSSISKYSNNALIIDTHKYNRESLRDTLKTFGFNVTEYHNLTESTTIHKLYSLIFIHENSYSQFRSRFESQIDAKVCNIVIMGQFGKTLFKDSEDSVVLLCPFQRQRVINLINSLKEGGEISLTPREERPNFVVPFLSEKYPLRILLAEDNSINTKVALQHLKKLGYQADHAKDGVEVIEKCEQLISKSGSDDGQDTYDVIFMDIQMPRMDGITATVKVAELYSDRGKPQLKPTIVALTANVAGDDRERSLKAGMADFLAKPILPKELKRILTNIGESKVN